MYEDSEQMEEEMKDDSYITECVVFISYNDGNIHVYSLPGFTEICSYSQIYELMIAEVGASDEQVMRECVLTVRISETRDE